ncbi:MAG: hypothetical protein HKM93_18015 [Desulfobacteraceae bacterium]|nr:hypothetical protein [Desulfobacteraceae bacterium]
MMKASILTFSQTGNTLKVGRAISHALGENGIRVEHTRYLHRNNWDPESADLIGIGCPVFENMPAECVPEYLQLHNFKRKKAFVFITSGGSPAKSLWHLSRALSRTGADVIGGMQLRGAVTVPTKFGEFTGRPDERDLAQASAFGNALAANITEKTALPDQYSINSKQGAGLYNILGPCLTYLKKKITPLPVSDPVKCTCCGNCVRECPTDSITINQGVVSFSNTCMVCYRCWHVCSSDAITMRFSPGDGTIERLLYANRMERFFGNIKADENIGPNLYKDVLARKIRLKYDRKDPTAEFETDDMKVH